VSDRTSADDAGRSGRRWLTGIGIAVPVVSGIVIPLLIWVVPNDHPSCDRQSATVGRIEVDKGRTFRDYLRRAGGSASGVRKAQLDSKVDIVTARVQIQKYPHVVVKVSAYRTDRAGRRLVGSIEDRPMFELDLEACETEQTIAVWTPALPGRTTYEVSLSDPAGVEIDRGRATA
jgi:hypothetical protein